MKRLLWVSFAIVLLMSWGMAIADNIAQDKSAAKLSNSLSQPVDIANKDKIVLMNKSWTKHTINRGKFQTASGKSASAATPETKKAPVVTSNPYGDAALNMSNKAPVDKVTEFIPKNDNGIPAPPPDPNVILQGGDNMEDAMVIPAIPYVDSGNTAGYTHDITLECGANTAPDVFYSYTPESDGWITISLTSRLMDTMLGILDENGVQIACNDDYWGTQSQISYFTVNTGSTYYIAVSGWSTNYGPYTLIVTGAISCAITCPEPNTPENEPDCYDGFVDDTNGGCNSTPNVFSPVSAGETICGKSGNYQIAGWNYRDTDWYVLTLHTPKVVRIEGMAEFPFALAVVAPPCPPTVLNSANAYPCEEINFATGTLEPGEYWIVALPTVFTGIPCGSDYYFTVTLERPPDAPPNDLCETATPITGPYPQTIYGTTVGATIDCPDILGMDGVWYSIDLPYELNKVSIDYCPTAEQITSMVYAYYYDCTDCAAYNEFYWVFLPCESLRIQPKLYYEIPGPTTIYYPVGIGAPKDFGFVIDVQEHISPPNDYCVDVTPVPLEMGVPLQFTGDNTDATNDCEFEYDDQAWAAFTTTECMNITIDFCGTTPYFNNIDIIIESDCPCNENTLYAYAWTNELCDNNWAAIWMTVPPGTYYYPIYSWIGAEGQYVININGEACSPPPANDNCADAEVIGEVANQPFSTISATYDGSNSCIASPDIWYLYNATSNDSVTVSLCGSSFDTKLAIYEGPDCPVAPDPPASVLLQGGEDIASATFIYDDLPVSYTGTTTGYIHNFPNTCGFEGCDVVYSYLPLANGAIDVEMCGTVSDTYIPALVIFDDTAIEIACSGDGCGLSGAPKLINVPVEAGRTYYIVITGYNNDEGGDYVLTISNPTFILLECNDDFCDYQSEITFDANSGSQYLIQVGGYWSDVGEGVISVSGGGSVCDYVVGDVNNDGLSNGNDIVAMVQIMRGRYTAPYTCECTPGNTWAVGTDVNNSCGFNGNDVTYYVRKIRGQVQLMPCADCPPARLAPAVHPIAAPAPNTNTDN